MPARRPLTDKARALASTAITTIPKQRELVSWWLDLDRVALNRRAHQELPRMSLSRFASHNYTPMSALQVPGHPRPRRLVDDEDVD